MNKPKGMEEFYEEWGVPREVDPLSLPEDIPEMSHTDFYYGASECNWDAVREKLVANPNLKLEISTNTKLASIRIVVIDQKYSLSTTHYVGVQQAKLAEFDVLCREVLSAIQNVDNVVKEKTE